MTRVRWDGADSPHELALALSFVLPSLPPDARARAACVCRAWRTAAAAPALWEELQFEDCAVRINDAALEALCARAGAALRTLSMSLEGGACARVTGDGMLAALRGGGCTGLRRLSTEAFWLWLTTEQVQQLAAACPTLTHTACAVRCSLLDAAAAAAALPGPLLLNCSNCNSSEGLMQLAECLRVNATLTSLNLRLNYIGHDGARQLAESLRVNATLTSHDLSNNRIGDAGARQLAESLRVNATLTNLDLGGNGIADVVLMQLAERRDVGAAA